MTLGSGLAAQFGMVEEVTYGTPVVVDRFLEFDGGESMALQKDRVVSEAIKAGSLVARSDRWADNIKGASGTVSFPLLDSGFGLLLKHCHGTVAITTPTGGTLARDHTHTLSDLFDTGSFTAQFGRPGSAQATHPFTYHGCMISAFTLSQEVDGLLMIEVEIDAEDEDTSTALAAASYGTAALLEWEGATVTLGGASKDVKSWSLTVNNALDVERYFLRDNQLKKQPIHSGLREITGTMTLEFKDLTEYALFQGIVTTADLVFKTEGRTAIEAALFPYLEVTLSEARIDGSTPQVSGTDVLEIEMPFTALDNGTDAVISTVYRTQDTAS